MTASETFKEKRRKLLFDLTLIILSTFFLFWGLYKAQSFLIPIATAVLFALLMIPVSNILEAWKINRIVASLINTMLLLLLTLGFFFLISVQIKGFLEDWDQIVETLQPKVESLENFILTHTPVDRQQLEEYKKENDISSLSGSGNGTDAAFRVLQSVFGFTADFLLTFIYIFFLINYRRRFKLFLLKLFPREKQSEALRVIVKTARVAQKYMFGKFVLIIFLTVLYAIGLGISGVDNFVFISILAALLSLIPYIGNIIGFGLAMALGVASGGESGTLLGIVIVFSVTQFIETYILEPYVVGDQVDIHPFFIIVTVILANIIWGVMGMVLVVPLVGMLNVVLKNVDSLKVFGFLLGNGDDEGQVDDNTKVV
ncbi:MAG TPA: AI-2E family transporter [Cyclobacteriaceae bacterium]|nr:AI-2E family transporter [Cyclobacteriaceae bacterium]